MRIDGFTRKKKLWKFDNIPVFQIGVGHWPLADNKWKWPIFSERSGQNGLSVAKPSPNGQSFLRYSLPWLVLVGVLERANYYVGAHNFQAFSLVIGIYLDQWNEWSRSGHLSALFGEFVPRCFKPRIDIMTKTWSKIAKSDAKHNICKV